MDHKCLVNRGTTTTSSKGRCGMVWEEPIRVIGKEAPLPTITYSVLTNYHHIVQKNPAMSHLVSCEQGHQYQGTNQMQKSRWLKNKNFGRLQPDVLKNLSGHSYFCIEQQYDRQTCKFGNVDCRHADCDL